MKGKKRSFKKTISCQHIKNKSAAAKTKQRPITKRQKVVQEYNRLPISHQQRCSVTSHKWNNLFHSHKAMAKEDINVPLLPL